jgi:uncharacterized surface protein with fasciclin (FAS1) repeats
MKVIYQSFLLLICSVIFVQCNNSATDEYYERPSWLEPPIYEVLEQQGRFEHYLQCVEQTEYADVLKGAGLYTVFAPNDDAFTTWLREKSYPSVADIPNEEAAKIVAYSIVYSQWTPEHLGDMFVNKQYEPGAFKRKTAYYTLPYRDPMFENNWVINESGIGALSYTISNYHTDLLSQNYKYLPVFTSSYFNSFQPAALTAVDYNTFYPDANYIGKNVQTGAILTEGIRAENGVIYEVSTVNEPMNNIDEIVHSEPQYSKFAELLDFKTITGEYVFKSYIDIKEYSYLLLDAFRKMRPHDNIDQIYLKLYASLGFSPLKDDIYSDDGTNETEKSGNTLFVPDNTVLDNFIRTKLLKYYTKPEDLPLDALRTLINTHMVKGLVWPTLYRESMNATGEYINGEGSSGIAFDAAGILDKKITSNGFIYGIDNIIKSRLFETVYSEIYLNPSHYMLNRAYVNWYNLSLREELMRSPLTGYTSERWTMVNFSDQLLKEDGYSYSDITSAFSHSDPLLTNASARLQRLMQMHLFPGLKNSEVGEGGEVTGFDAPPFTGNVYDGWGYLVNSYGDMIRYKNNQLQATGNIEDGTFVTVTKVDDEFNNGYVFNADKLLQYSSRESGNYIDLPLWTYLDRARSQNSNVKDFVDYLEVCLKGIDSGELDGIKTANFYTVLMPNNTAMNLARSSGYLPTLAEISGSDTDASEKRAIATQFINAHILQGTVFADDGLQYIYPVNPMSPNEAIAPTLLKITDDKLGLVNESAKIKIYKYLSGSTWILRFEPQDIKIGNRILVDGAVGSVGTEYVSGVNRGKIAANNTFRSNRMACKAVLHEIASFFRFTLNEQ